MIGQLSRKTPVIVQGATGRAGSVHVRRMKEYGTNVVAGVSARGAGTTVEGVPMLANCRAAVGAIGAQVSLLMVTPNAVLASAEDAIAAGIKLIVTVAEGVPVQDAMRVGRIVRAAGAQWVGASTPGLAVPGEMKLGFLPNVSLRPGPLGMMSKSGTLSYETARLRGTCRADRGSACPSPDRRRRRPRSIGRDPSWRGDSRTKGIVLVGEIGGSEEEDFADALMKAKTQKPVDALVAGGGAKEG